MLVIPRGPDVSGLLGASHPRALWVLRLRHGPAAAPRRLSRLPVAPGPRRSGLSRLELLLVRAQHARRLPTRVLSRRRAE